MLSIEIQELRLNHRANRVRAPYGPEYPAEEQRSNMREAGTRSQCRAASSKVVIWTRRVIDLLAFSEWRQNSPLRPANYPDMAFPFPAILTAPLTRKPREIGLLPRFHANFPARFSNFPVIFPVITETSSRRTASTTNHIWRARFFRLWAKIPGIARLWRSGLIRLRLKNSSCASRGN